MTNFRTMIFANTFDVVECHFIWLNRTIRLKAVINEYKSESRAKPYVNLLNANYDFGGDFGRKKHLKSYAQC